MFLCCTLAGCQFGLLTLAFALDLVACRAIIESSHHPPPWPPVLRTLPAVIALILAVAATAQERHTLTGHDGWVGGIAFYPDGKLFVTASATIPPASGTSNRARHFSR